MDAANKLENMLIAVLGNGLADHLCVRDLAVLECTSPVLKRSILILNLWHKLTVRETRPWYLELRKKPWYLESCNLIATAVAVKDVREVYVDYEGITPEFLRYLCDVEQAAAGRPLRFTGRVARVEYPRIRYAVEPFSYECERPHFDVASGTFGAGFEREFSFIARHFPRATIVIEGAEDGGRRRVSESDSDDDAEARVAMQGRELAYYGRAYRWYDDFELSPPALRGIIAAIDCFLRRLSFTGDVCLGNFRDIVVYSHGQDFGEVPWLEPDEPDQPPDEPEQNSYCCSTGTCLFRGAFSSVGVDHPSGIHFTAHGDELGGTNEVYFKHEWITWSVGKLVARDE